MAKVINFDENMNEIIPKEIVYSKDYAIIKKASERVYEQLFGSGLSENAYQTAMFYELSESYDNVQMEYHVSQHYTTTSGRKVLIADLRIDILIDYRIILELKAVGGVLEKRCKKTGELKMDEIKASSAYLQCSRYMRLLKNIDGGYVINFGEKGLDFIVVN